MKRIALALALGMIVGAAGSAAARLSCREEAGAAKAQTYVTQCIMVSPATHPPCNDNNPCDVIIAEIRRGCELVQGAHERQDLDFCRNYLQPTRKPAPSSAKD